MPMMDAYIPEGALSPEAERTLLKRATDLLLEHEGADPSNEAAQSIAWIFVHRPEVYAGGEPATEPRYRFVCQVPEGQYDDERRAAVTAALTRAVAEAEAGEHPNPEFRTWVFTHEIPDGQWGGLGQIFRLPDIAGFVAGDDARERAVERLAARRHEEAEAILSAAARV